MRKYQRKTKNTPDPNDRGYSRKVEKTVKRMNPEELGAFLRDDGVSDDEQGAT